MTADRMLQLQTGVSTIDPAQLGSVWSVTTARLKGERVVIIAGSGDGILQRIDAATGQELEDLSVDPPGPVWSLTVADLPDSQAVIFCGSGDGAVSRIDAATGHPVGDPIFAHAGRVLALATCTLSDGRPIVVSGGGDGTIRRFDAGTGQAIGDPIRAPAGHTGPVLAITTATLPDGRTIIVSGGDDGTVRCFGATDGAQVVSPIAVGAGRVQAVAATCLPGKRTVIISGAADGSLRRFDASTGEPIGEPIVGHSGRVWSLASLGLPDGRAVVVSGGDDGRIRRFDVRTGVAVGEPIGRQAGRVLSVAVAALSGQQVIIISGGSNKTVHRYDASTGNPLGEPVVDPSGRVWSVAVMSLWNRTMVISGGDDGTLRRFDAETGTPIGDPISAHTGRIWSVAGARLPGRRALLVSGGDDGCLRRFDPQTGASAGNPITDPEGHSGPVLCVAIGSLPGGRTTILSGSGDGTVRQFDAETGQPVGSPFMSADELTGPVSAVAYSSLADGRYIVVSGGDDGAIRRYDAVTGEPLGAAIIAPLGHTGPVLSIATTTLPDGRTIIISCGDDGTLRRFEAATGSPVGAPIAAHNGLVWSVAAAITADGRVILVSGGGDETIRCFDAVTGERIGGPISGITGPSWSVRIGELPNGRTIVVSGGDGGAFVIWPSDLDTGLRTEAPALVDSAALADELGRGVLAGHLVGLLAQLTEEQDANSAVVHVDGRWGSGKSTLVQLLIDRLRSDHLSPQRSAALALHDPLVVHYDAWRESAISPEWWSLATAINRAVRNERSMCTRVYLTLWTFTIRTFRSASTVAAFLLFAAALLSWQLIFRKNLPALGAGITAATGLAAVTLGAGRLLFWYAPTLHMRTDSNPLGEIANLVGWLRRWSPRDVRRQRARDRLVGIILAAFLAAIIIIDDIAASIPARPYITAGLAVVAGITIGWHIAWSRRLAPNERCPVVVVIDDLDRCGSARVVKLLEAVHTLLREPVSAGRSGSRWRTPARLIILILADGRWVRTSFASEFAPFDSLSSAVHGLGADFTQKIFDHTVLVPALSADQVQSFVGSQLKPRLAADGTGDRIAEGNVQTAVGTTSSVDQTIRQIESAEPAELRSVAISARIEDPSIPLSDRFLLEEVRALREASSEATVVRRDHLLQEYPSLMPANPRLIKRVANAFGMLLAMKGHLGHKEDMDTVARAAIMLVRFPSLVDDLLDATSPPATTAGEVGADSPWLRPDVQQLLAETDVIRLARCYGHVFPSADSSAEAR